MSQEHNMRRVTAIRNGTVIDHIPAGQAMRVLEMLGINKGTSVPVSLVMNVPSKKMGTKDIIKVEDRELNQDELNRLALVAPDAHVAIIRAYSVAEKLTIELGEEIVNVVRCTFSNCITTNPREPLAHRLKIVARAHLNYVATTAADRKTWMNWFQRALIVDHPKQIPHVAGFALDPRRWATATRARLWGAGRPSSPPNATI